LRAETNPQADATTTQHEEERSMTTKDNDLVATLIGAWPGDDAPVAVVTGAARGIGRAIGDWFASNGVRVVVNDLQPEAADQAAREITEAGGQALGVGGDVSDLPPSRHWPPPSRTGQGASTSSSTTPASPTWSYPRSSRMSIAGR
jgi:hypothetical protein